jgi:hypothetical protein
MSNNLPLFSCQVQRIIKFLLSYNRNERKWKFYEKYLMMNDDEKWENKMNFIFIWLGTWQEVFMRYLNDAMGIVGTIEKSSLFP